MYLFVSKEIFKRKGKDPQEEQIKEKIQWHWELKIRQILKIRLLFYPQKLMSFLGLCENSKDIFNFP